MKNSHFHLYRRLIAIAVLALFVSQLSLPGIEGVRGAYAADAFDALSVTAPDKESVGMDDTDDMDLYGGGAKSNVLFMLESTAIMSFTPKGVMPTIVRKSDWYNYNLNQDNIDWDATKTRFGIDLDKINYMMEQATFGMGALPVAMTGRNLRRERNLYGRDVDPSNNYIKLSNDPVEDLRLNAEQGRHYYAPFANGKGKELKSAYASQKTALNVGYDKGTNDESPYNDIDVPKVWFSVKGATPTATLNTSLYNVNGMAYGRAKSWAKMQGCSAVDYGAVNSVNGEPIRFYSSLLPNSDSLPYALVTQWPDRWAGGDTTRLVPNDSRMYQAKLVLWRILEEEERLLKQIRFGLASTFLSLSTYSDTNTSTSDENPGYSQHNALNRFDIGGIFKVSPFGSNVYAIDKRFWGNQASQTSPPEGARFKNGILNQGITGNVANWSGIHGQILQLWTNPPISPMYDPKTNPEWNAPAREMYKLLNRASLHVPIADADYEWKSADGTKKMSHIDKVRMWIDGFADIKGVNTGWGGQSAASAEFMKPAERSSQLNYHKNPEIGIAGTFQLPMAIYPNPDVSGLNREDYINNGYIWYSAKNHHLNYFGDFRLDPNSDAAKSYGEFYSYIFAPRAHYNAGSGEAAGSVLDFFSPPANFKVVNKTEQKLGQAYPHNAIQLVKAGKTGPAESTKDVTSVSAADLDPVSFPIRSDCEDNWMVLLASGQEMKPISDNEKKLVYPGYRAIGELYKHTSTKPLNTIKRDADGNPILKGGAVQIETVKLQNPIRTIVIGIVGDPAEEADPVVKQNIMEMRANLDKMALAGMGYDPAEYFDLSDSSHTVPKKALPLDARAIFAKNVDELSAAMRMALTIVNESRINQPGKGPLVQSPTVPGETYETKDGTVLSADLNIYQTTYRIVRYDQWDATFTHYKGVLDRSGNLKLVSDWEMGNKIMASVGKKPGESGRRLRYWKGGSLRTLDEGDAHFKRLVGMTDEKIDANNLPNGVGGVSPHDALVRWLKGYDYSYTNSESYPRLTMLGDFGQSGVVFVNKPSVGASSVIPGYNEWAKGQSSRPPKIYAQTNDGVLHVVNYEQGTEELAILPPPVLIPNRLASLKTDSAAGGKMSWKEITQNTKSQSRSNPAYTLDGPLQKYDFDLSQSGTEQSWGTYLLGSLGRGGNGLYMVDISDGLSPKLLWYREHAGNSLISMTAHDDIPTVKSSGFSDKETPLLKLGYNSPEPGLGYARTPDQNRLQNIVVVPGGLQSNVDLSKNGEEGAVLLFLDPKDGSLLRHFDGNSINSGWRLGSGGTGPAPYMGMMVSPPTLAKSTGSPYLTGSVYTMDNRGNIFRTYMEDATGGLDPKGWYTRTVASLQENTNSAKSSSESYANPYGVSIGMEGSATWVVGGTADVNVKAGSNYPTGVIRNKAQFIYSFRTDNALTDPILRSELEPLDANDTDSMVENTAATKGWYIPLLSGSATQFSEYVSAKPLLLNGVLYVATFIRRDKVNLEDTVLCGLVRTLSGEARLYALDVKSGAAALYENSRPLWKDGAKYITLDNVKITGLTTYTRQDGSERVIITFDKLSENNNLDAVAAAQEYLTRVTYLGGGNTEHLELTPRQKRGGGGVNLNQGRNIIFNWHLY
ncbi:MAG: hypothetical protein LBQ58_01060 [Synergistaceae bacterium]|jgi:hypothetical protein|nr:hypothetical protein [Synergistaceae bacterium]